MPKISDQEFDNLFRQAANRVTPEPQPGDWDEMQRRLEAAERDARARNISLYSMVALLFLYSFIMPDSLKFGDVERTSMIPGAQQIDSQLPQADEMRSGDTDKASKSEASTTSIEDASKSTPYGEHPALGGEQTAVASKVESSGAAPSKNEALKTNARPIHNSGKGTPSSVANGKSDKNADTVGSVAAAAAVSAGTEASQAGDPAGDRKTGDEKSVASDTPQFASGSGVVKGDAQQTHSGAAVIGAATGEAIQQPRAAGAFPSATEKVIAPGNPNSSTAVFDVDSPEAPSTDPLQAEPKRQPASVLLSPPGKVVAFELPRHPWFVKLAVSPDFSSIDYGSAGKTGLNFGPMVEYGISPRFSVSTGAIWSKKLYDQQNPEKTYGSGGYTVHANKLVGDCRIIDIPMNVTYYLMPGRKTNLFVTAGVSSYIMLKEDYIYTVSRNNNDYEYEENYSHKNNEWFSMLNLSLGLQQQIANRWFIQGEPFLKAPMKGVGEGKVNLVSAGVFVSVKYKINR